MEIVLYPEFRKSYTIQPRKRLAIQGLKGKEADFAYGVITPYK